MTSDFAKYREPPRKIKPQEADPIHPSTLPLWRDVRNSACALCPLHSNSMTVCMMGTGRAGPGMIIGESPTPSEDRMGLPGGVRGLLYMKALAEKDLDFPLDNVYQTYALKCVSEGASLRDIKQAQKACAVYLLQEIARLRPVAIFAMGESAYYFFTHAAGISKRRGKAFEWTHPDDPTLTIWIVPTINPDKVIDDPKLHPAFAADLMKWIQLSQGQGANPAVEVIDIHSGDAWRTAQYDLAEAASRGLISFDLETRGMLSVRANYSRVWLAGITSGADRGNGIMVWNLGLEHPDAPWYYNEPLKREIVRSFCELVLLSRINGHNVSFDLRWVWSLVDRYGFTVDSATGEIR